MGEDELSANNGTAGLAEKNADEEARYLDSNMQVDYQ
jgi:hypothetical protein